MFTLLLVLLICSGITLLATALVGGVFTGNVRTAEGRLRLPVKIAFAAIAVAIVTGILLLTLF